MSIEINKVYNMDCLDLMREMEKQGIVADWLIADPPYGIGIEKMAFTNGVTKIGQTGLAKRGEYQI